MILRAISQFVMWLFAHAIVYVIAVMIIVGAIAAATGIAKIPVVGWLILAVLMILVILAVGAFIREHRPVDRNVRES